MIDLLKALLFFVLYSSLRKKNKIEIIIELAIILSHKGNTSKKISFDRPEKKDKYRVKERILYSILSLMLSSVILPFLFKYESEIKDDDFLSFYRYITLNVEIFYIHSRKDSNLFEHGVYDDDTNELTVKVSKVREHLANNYKRFFKPTFIRKNLIEAWEQFKEKESSDSEDNELETPGEPERAYLTRPKTERQVAKIEFSSDKDEKWFKNPIKQRKGHQINADQMESSGFGMTETKTSTLDKKPDFNQVKRFHTLREYRISTEVEQKLQLDDDDLISPNRNLGNRKFRMPKEGIINTSQSSGEHDESYCPELEEKFGFHLIQYFSLYFGGHKNPGKFECVEKR
jgi:hypothetical protein